MTNRLNMKDYKGGKDKECKEGHHKEEKIGIVFIKE